MRIIQTISLTFLLSFSLLSCSDSGTGPGTNPKPLPTDSEITISGAEDESTQSGTLSLSVEGGTGSSYSELRIKLGSKVILTVTNPTLPIEFPLESFRHANGEHELTAELAVNGSEQVLSDTLTLFFKNYLLKINTSMYEDLSRFTHANFTISGPGGNILGSINLKESQPEVLSVLPPEALDENPAYFNITYATVSGGAVTSTRITTHTGFTPWDTFIGKAYVAPATSSTNYGNSLDIIGQNVPFEDYTSQIGSDDRIRLYRPSVNNDNPFLSGIDMSSATNQIAIVLNPRSKEGTNPLFKWEKDLDALNLSAHDTLRYDVSTDFEAMSVQDVTHSSDIKPAQYYYVLSPTPEAWVGSDLYFEFRGPGDDGNPAEDRLGMYVPKTNHPYRSLLVMQSTIDESVSYIEVIPEPVPTAFTKLDVDGSVQIEGSYERLNISTTGNADILEITGSFFSPSSGFNNWHIFTADTMKTIHLPDLGQIIDRNDLALSSLSYTDYASYDGFADYLDEYWKMTDIPRGTIYRRKVTRIEDETGALPQDAPFQPCSYGFKHAATALPCIW